jgi:hypothetical protein
MSFTIICRQFYFAQIFFGKTKNFAKNNLKNKKLAPGLESGCKAQPTETIKKKKVVNITT